MKISSVDVVNFMAIGKAKFSLANQGLVLIAGENKDDPSADSNGAGKSSLMEAVCWALWGKTAKGVTGDAVIRAGERKTLVAVELQDESGDSWTIIRNRSKGKGGLTVAQTTSAGSQDITAGTEKLTQEKIAQILGCTEEVFRSAVYIGQENLPDLPAMTDKQLKELIEEAAGVKLLELAYAIARERERAALLAVSEHKATIDKSAALIAGKKEARNREEAHSDRWNDEMKTKMDTLAERIAANHTAHADKFEFLRTKRDRAAIEADLAAIDGKLALLSAEQDEERRLQAKLVSAGRVHAEKSALLKARLRDIPTLKRRVEEVGNQIGTPCKACGTPLTEEHLCAVRESAENDLREATTAAQSERDTWEVAKRDAEAAQSALDANRAAMRDPSALTAERVKLTGELNEVAAIERDMAIIFGNTGEVVKERDALGKTPNPHLPLYVKLLGEISVLETHHAGLTTALSELETTAQHAALATQVFSPAGVRAQILDEVTPALNERTSVYLTALTDGMITATWSTLSRTAKGELRERFAIDVQHTANGQGFASLSGGEKRKVRLACALALQDLVATRASKPIDLWVADEIDTALDAAGLERLMMVLQEKARERGTVMVVSHQSLKDWIPNSWTVVKEKGQAELVV